MVGKEFPKRRAFVHSVFHFMNVVELRGVSRCRTRPSRGIPLCAIGILGFAGTLVGTAAEPAAAAETKAAAGPDDDPADQDAIVSLAAYNVRADRIEDFGFRVEGLKARGSPPGSTAQPNLVTLWFTTFAPMITTVVPNTAAAKAGLRPGERILKSEGQSTVGGPFSTGKFGQWHKTQKKKWEDVGAGKKNVTWTLEVEASGTKAVRTVKLVVPTPPPHWGASVWRMPEGRVPATVREPGPLAERCRAVLDNGIWTLVYANLLAALDQSVSFSSEPTGYEWHLENQPDGRHRILVTQVRGRTDVFLETYSNLTGAHVYHTSPSGVLEKAWQWRRGKLVEVPGEEARAGFAHELDLWTTKVGKVSARWPFELKPGYDPNAIFSILAKKRGAPAIKVARPFAEEFLKLPSAIEAEKELFTEAYAKLGAQQDCWAYTETSRGLEDKRVIVTRIDPSKPEAERCVLLSIDGEVPTPADVQRWRDEGGDLPKPLGDLPPLTSIVELKDLRVFTDDTAAVVFELPIRNGSAEFPAEKFQALFRVNKTHRAFEDITVRMRDSFRVAGVVKITEAGLHARFQTLDAAYPPQPVLLKAGGAARILFVKISRDFETTRADFQRVQPYVEPDPGDPAAAPISIPVPRTL